MVRPLGAAFARRHALGSFAACAAVVGAGGCAPPADSASVSANDLYVGLARARTVLVLDSATDEERRRVSLGPLGSRNIPWRIGVGPSGNAAVVPLVSSEPNVGVIAANAHADRPPAAVGRSSAGGRRVKHQASAEQCGLVGVGTGRPRGQPYGVREMAETLAADGLGRAYVLIGDGGMREPSYAAVVDLRRSITLRHLPLAPSGETVFALAGAPDGDRLFVSIWAWDGLAAGRPTGAGRLVAIDTTTGIPLTRASLPIQAAVTDVTLAAAPLGSPGGVRRALYAVVGDPGPSRDDDDWWTVPTSFFLTALDPARLDPIGWWPLSERPTSVAVTPDGARAYLLLTGGWTTVLSCLDLTHGAVTHRWPLPASCLGLALSPVGKAYVADPFGDRLWRVDTASNTLLEPLPLTGAPIALATT